MRVDIRRIASLLACGVSGPLVALSLAGAAAAEPATPVVPPAPVPAPVPGPASAPGPVPGPTAQAAGDPGALPVEPQVGTPHLASPDALPPGATMDPSGQGNETPNLSYLKDLWHAVQSQEISGKEALILGVAQRGMNTPVPGQAPGPNVPVSPGASGPMGGPVAPGASLSPGTPMPPGTPMAPELPGPAVPAGPSPAPLP